MMKHFDNRPEDFYIDTTIEYQDRRTDEYWEDTNVPYDEVIECIEDRSWEGLEMTNVIYYLNDMLAGSEDKPQELDEDEAYKLHQMLEALR